MRNLRLRSLARQRPSHSAEGIQRTFKANDIGRRRRLKWFGQRPGDPRKQEESSYGAMALGQRWASHRPVAKAQEVKAIQEEKTWDALGGLY